MKQECMIDYGMHREALEKASGRRRDFNNQDTQT